MNDLTEILAAVERGDGHAAGELLPLVYDELRASSGRMKPLHTTAGVGAGT
jgi:hypothetical protein